jgi:antitoxin component YwqK of YwqJK toxin-antitoxin module
MKKILLLLLFFIPSLLFGQTPSYMSYEGQPNYVYYTLTDQETGTILEKGTYYKGKKTGQWIAYHPNGKVHCKFKFKKGKRVGKWKTYNPAGNLIMVHTYKNGQVENVILAKYY